MFRSLFYTAYYISISILTYFYGNEICIKGALVKYLSNVCILYNTNHKQINE